MSGTYEILEHTADVGLHLEGDTVEQLFEAAARGLAELQDAWAEDDGEDRTVRLHAGDRGALLVAWLDELLYLHEGEDVLFSSVEVSEVTDSALSARVRLVRRGDRMLEAVGVKAATYHRLRVDRAPNGRWSADVYVDV